MDLHPGIPLEGRRGDVVVVADADDGRIGIEARQDRIANDRGIIWHALRQRHVALAHQRSTAATAPNRSSTPEADEERRVADGRHQAADQQREDQQARIAERARHARDRRDFVLPEQVGRHRDHRHRERLVREPAETEQRDRGIRSSARSRQTPTPSIRNAPRVKAQRRALIRLSPARFCSVIATSAAEHAAEIGGQKRQPREQRDLLQIQMPHAAQIQRQPETQRAPRRIGQESRQRDSPEVALPQDLAHRRARCRRLADASPARRRCNSVSSSESAGCCSGD